MRILVLLVALFVAVPAWAGTIAVVDFQRAVTETDEGKSAQARLDAMYSTRKTEIDNMRVSLESELKDFQARAMILSEEARAEQEQTLYMKQQQFQQTYMTYQQEMQQNYYTLLQDLDTKMRALTATIGRERNYDLVIDMAAVVYVGPGTVDMTDELIQRYNQQ
jgi:Skp family chaperone for outer membrane proteins